MNRRILSILKSISLNATLICLLSFCLLGFIEQSKSIAIPVYFKEYGVEIRSIPKLKDTIMFQKSNIETFKFVFFDFKGKSYCERYENGNLIEKGYYENSLSILKRYVSHRKSGGESFKTIVQSYYQPLRNGTWFFFNKNKMTSQKYELGIEIEAK